MSLSDQLAEALSANASFDHGDAALAQILSS